MTAAMRRRAEAALLPILRARYRGAEIIIEWDDVETTVSPESKPEWADLARYADHEQRGLLLVEHAEALSDADYWQAVGEAWQDSDRQQLTPPDWRRLWASHRPARAEIVMTPEERDELAGLPERVTIYRGVNARNAMSGLSWTLDHERAVWFACRFVNPDWPGLVITGAVRRERILALFNARGEHEIVVLPKFVYDRTRAVTQ